MFGVDDFSNFLVESIHKEQIDKIVEHFKYGEHILEYGAQNSGKSHLFSKQCGLRLFGELEVIDCAQLGQLAAAGLE